MRTGKKRDVTGRAKRFAAILALACSFAHGYYDCFLHEVSDDFWDTNLVATVVGYCRVGQDRFLGVPVPRINKSDAPDKCEEAWFYSIAPTNHAGILFRFYSCSPSSVRDIYPTNQLFVFPVVSEEKGIRRDKSVLISKRGASCSYSRYSISDKLFPINDRMIQDLVFQLNKDITVVQERIAETHDKLAKTEDEKKRSSLVSALNWFESYIERMRNEIEKLSEQSRYFQDRVKWLKSQGVPPPDEENE